VFVQDKEKVGRLWKLTATQEARVMVRGYALKIPMAMISGDHISISSQRSGYQYPYGDDHLEIITSLASSVWHDAARSGQGFADLTTAYF
jgi:hypothetical protein